MKVTSPSEFGAQIRARRREKGLTQTELAQLCGVSLRFVSEVERGRASAGLGLVLRLASRLALDVDISPREVAS